jgi:hypothetical protein
VRCAAPNTGAHGSLFQREQDAVVAQAEAECARHIVVESLHIAGTSASEMEYSFE